MNILFVCTGNTCRSPMAEALFREMIGDAQVVIRSAGLAAMDGQDASVYAKEVLMNRNIVHEHRSQMVTDELVDWADLILTMTFAHKMAVLTRYRQSEGKVYTLKEYVTEDAELETDKRLDWDIADPFGGNYETYQNTAAEIEENLKKLQKKIN